MAQYFSVENIFPTVRYGVHRKTEKGWKIDSRIITDHEFVLIEKGSGSIIIEEKIYIARPGMFFYFSPGIVHSLCTDDDEPFSFYAVHFSYVFLEKEKEQWIVSSATTNLPLQSVQNIYNYRVLAENMAGLIDYLNRHLQNWGLMVRTLFQSCIYHLFQYNAYKKIDHSAKVKIDTVANYIAINIEKNFTAGELAELVKVTPDYISRLFKKYTGNTLISYINLCKIARAKTYLIENNVAIRKIANTLSFSDEFYFSKVFKKVEGISPSQFRRIVQLQKHTL
jgi:AraC-like DNA-binding protein